MYREGVLGNRRQAINRARPLSLDDAVIVPYRIQVLVLVERLELILNAIDRFKPRELLPQNSAPPQLGFFD